MSDVELIDKLTQIVGWQSEIIRRLHEIVKQAELTTSLDASVETVQKQSAKILSSRNED